MVGYLDGIGSKGGIAWRCRDSISLREYLGCGLAKAPPEHTTLSKTPKRLSPAAHGAVFSCVLERLRKSGPLWGKAVGLGTEARAVAIVTVQTMEGGDTASLALTLDKTERWLAEAGAKPRQVADKGYHANATMMSVEDRKLRSCGGEPNRDRRKWRGKPGGPKAVYGTRRRIRANRGKRLFRWRGDKLERTFAHLLVSGGLPGFHVCKQEEIGKRLPVHMATFNLRHLMHKPAGFGTSPGWQGLATAAALADPCSRHFATVAGQIEHIFGLSIAPTPALLAPQTVSRTIRTRSLASPPFVQSACWRLTSSSAY